MAGSQYDAGPSVASVYVFLCNTSDAGLELESIRALRYVPYTTLELTLVTFQFSLLHVGHVTLGPASYCEHNTTLGPAS